MTKSQRVETYLYSFKGIVLLLKTKFPPRFRSKGSAFRKLLSTVVPNSQTLYFMNREVDIFNLKQKSKDPIKVLFFFRR